MFATLKSFLLGNGKSSKPVRRVQLGMETLESRATPAACAFQQWRYDGLEGERYEDVKVGTYVIQGTKDLSKDDYDVYGGDWRFSSPRLEQEGRKLIIKDDLRTFNEGAKNHFYSIIRKRDNKLMLSSQAKLEAGNAPVSAMATREFFTVSGHDSGSQLIATFFDSHNNTSAAGSFTALINWGDGTNSEGQVVISGNMGNVIQVFGSHTYKHKSNICTGYTITVKVGDTDVGNMGSKFCTSTHNVADPKGGSVAVGGMATATTMAWVTPSPWYEDLFGEQAVKVEEAVRTAWVAFTADAKDTAKDLFKSLGGDAAANQKLLVNTANAVLRRIPSGTSTVWDGIVQEAIRLAPSQPGRTLQQVAFDVALRKLTTMVQDNLKGLNVEVAGISDLSAAAGPAGLTEAARKLADTAAKGIADRTMLERYLKIHRPQINPGKPNDDNATLTAANMDVVLKASAGVAVAPEKVAIADWQSLETVTSQRLGRAVTFGAEQTGKDLSLALAALANGSTGVIHSAPTQAKPHGTLMSFVKINGQVFVLDARLGQFASLNATTKYQMLNTTK